MAVDCALRRGPACRPCVRALPSFAPMNASAAPGALAPISPRSPIAHPLAWLLAIALAHVAVRVSVSPALKWDEAEQMLWSQQLAWGYGAQPPLYTWLQWALNLVFGPSVLALSLLKHTLLALTYALMYLAGRELLGPRGAWWASASMLLLPALGWYSIRDQTHTILVTAMTCGAWWLLLRGLRRPQPATFAWLGLVCGLGLLAKYNFALVAVAMGAAALSLPEGRRALRTQGGWLAPVLALLVVLPHAQWLLAHLPQATEGTVQRMDISAQPRWGRGLRELAAALQAQGYDGRSTIIAADPVLAGILRTRFAQAPVGACSAHEGESPAQITTCVAAAQAQAAQAGLGWLLISRDTRLQPHWWPHALASRAEANGAAIAPQHIRLPYRTLLRTFPADVPPADYQYVWQPPAVAPSGAQR